MDVIISAMKPEDWEAVRAIYQQGIATGNATFETEAPDWKSWDEKHRPDCRLVARVEGQVVGWAAMMPVSSRRAYAGVCEHSIYIADAARGKGIGKTLLTAFIAETERAGIWTLHTSIFPENVASITLHKSCGFREIGYRERVAQLNGVWRNTVMLERRSNVVGQ
jgi:phosphinothricin acetyltransferase